MPQNLYRLNLEYDFKHQLFTRPHVKIEGEGNYRITPQRLWNALLDCNALLQIFLIYLQIFLIHLVIFINTFQIFLIHL